MSDATPPGEPAQPPEPVGATPPPAAPQPEPGAVDAGLDPKVGGLLAYLLFGWIGGLIMFLTQKHPEVRFHGAQSILLSIALFALYIALWVLGFIFALLPGIDFIGAILIFLATFVVGIGGFALWIFMCIKGYSLDHFKLPFIGDMAEKWAAS